MPTTWRREIHLSARSTWPRTVGAKSVDESTSRRTVVDKESNSDTKMDNIIGRQQVANMMQSEHRRRRRHPPWAFSSLHPTFPLSMCLIVASLLIAQQQSIIEPIQCKQAKPSSQTAATSPYSEAIKWSFGGWAPLNGMPSNRTVHASRNESSLQMATSPLPPMHLPGPTATTTTTTTTTATVTKTIRAGNATANRQQSRPSASDSLSESASSSHEKVQFASPINHQGDLAESHLLLDSQQPHKARLHSGPAYALPLQRPPQPQASQHRQHRQQQQHFSPPAPVPIVREQLLPAANQQQHQHHQERPRLPGPPQAGPFPPQMMYAQQGPRVGPPMLPNGHHLMMQPHGGHPMHGRPQAPQMMRPGPQIPPHMMHMAMMSAHSPHGPHNHQQRQHEQHLRQMEQHHRQQMMQGHRQHQMQMMQQHLHKQHLRPMQHHEQAPTVGTFKVIEGEQPVIFTHPLAQQQQQHQQQQERIPMIEIGGNSATKQHPPQESQANYRNMSSQQQQQQQEAVEKDNLNYQQTLSQVNDKSPAEEQQREYPSKQSNNIQDIKQRQQYEQQQQQAHNGNNEDHSNKATSKTPYLTIPVAVETEGDKVLTPDDISEIEKHVINVLPNLKTADKIVKLADSQLSLAAGGQQQQQHASASSPSAPQRQQQHSPGTTAGPEMHQMHYEEHKSTMQQLEGDLKDITRHRPAAQSTSSSSSSPVQPINQASTASAHHEAAPEVVVDPAVIGQHLGEHQYFIAAGPPQEVGPVDHEQMSEYNLIKNDLLSNFRYEPTRATSGGGGSSSTGYQQTASTPPMPYTASRAPQQHQQSTGGPGHQANRRPAPSVTRYFHQGKQAMSSPAGYNRGHANNNLFGRIRQPSGYQQQQQQTSTTRTLLGGRKVSEVMRNLIHTTPVPMTSPMHIPSVEPEKVDAIQLIAGQANDKQPMIIEPHQLVSHTPDGGIDYTSGGANQQAAIQQQQAQQQQQQQQQPMQHQNNSMQYGQSGPSVGSDDNQGAIIEYVAINDQALSNAISAQEHQPHGQQAYEIASTPEAQPVYVGGDQQQPPVGEPGQSSRAPFMYDYTMTTSQQASNAPTTASYMPGSANNNGEQVTTILVQQPEQHQQQQQQAANVHGQQQQQHQQQEPSLAWSPSVASEHQQQQLEQLGGHLNAVDVGHLQQQMDMPATAGYNFFNQQDQSSQPPATTTAAMDGQQDYEQQQQQLINDHQQQQRQPSSSPRWRTKAGGSQPNPDAQYDGQIAKGGEAGESQGQDEAQNSQHDGAASGDDRQQQEQQYVQQAELARLEPQQVEHQQQEQQQHQTEYATQAAPEATGAGNNFNGPQNNYQEQQSTPASQQQDGGYNQMSTNSFVGGAQLNFPTAPPHGGNRQPPYGQSQPSAPVGQYSYAKLDHDRQQTHLAQHQAQLAEQQQQQQSYQTTTPVTLTTLAVAMEQQQQQEVSQPEQEARQEQQQQQHQQVGANQQENEQQQQNYMVEQVQSRPSVQSGDSLLVNESPMQLPILDQQSLLADGPNQDNTNEQISDDDAAKQRQQSQPAGVYQVYQAYYAPKDHKPLPGYVRLSLDEFNELFRDAEIQYVDRNLNNLGQNLINAGRQHSSGDQQQQQQQQQQVNNYEQTNEQYQSTPTNMADQMKASASEAQSIVVDRRSISERRSSNATTDSDSQTSTGSKSTDSNNRRLKLGQAVKKIISIRNSRQTLAKQAKASKLVMKRVKTPTISPTNVFKSTVNKSTPPGSVVAPTQTPIKGRLLEQPKSQSGKPTKSKTKTTNVDPKKTNGQQATPTSTRTSKDSTTTTTTTTKQATQTTKSP